jgi:uncharacterized protein YgbK (DUF1537 family)
MLLGCIADDFTGASDLANVLARGGMRTIQFNGIPQRPVACEAGIISLKSRSIPAADAVRQSLDALEWLRDQGCQQYLFKYCSTFDSTPAGNIGPVADALLDALNVPSAIVCPAFPTLKRSIYRGHLFVGDKLLNESGLENHPLNPMTDANLVRWLGLQTKSKVGLIPYDIVAAGAAAVRQALAGATGEGVRLIVCDCIRDEDLITLGTAAADMKLITGGSGIALGLPQNFRARRMTTGAEYIPSAPAGPVIALAGSCSGATRAQVVRHSETQPALRLEARAIVEGGASPAEAWSWAREQSAGAIPLIYTSADPKEVREAQATFGAAHVAHAIEAFFAALAAEAVNGGAAHLIVAGGETSSAVVTGLEIDAMEIGPEIDPGVPVLVADRPRLLALALKSGNFGAEDFFAKAARLMDEMV